MKNTIAVKTIQKMIDKEEGSTEAEVVAINSLDNVITVTERIINLQLVHACKCTTGKDIKWSSRRSTLAIKICISNRLETIVGLLQDIT